MSLLETVTPGLSALCKLHQTRPLEQMSTFAEKQSGAPHASSQIPNLWDSLATTVAQLHSTQIQTAH